MKLIRYVLITAARNEQGFIERTIGSVIGQGVLPEKWVIVSDGSTDRTDEIIKFHAARFPWIHYIRGPEHANRQFASKARCINVGYAELGDVQYEVIGNVDADISFGPSAMEFILDRFARDSRLGVAGLPFCEEAAGFYNYSFTNIEHVSGACQMFRRECFEAVGGYKPIRAGGIDWLAVTTARMMGWKTRTFPEMTIVHHRSMGTGEGSKLDSLFRLGKKDYSLGNHPLWEIFRVVYQMGRKPRGLGGLTIFAGYMTALVSRMEKSAPADVVRFCRREQMQRLAMFLRIHRVRTGQG